MGFSSGHIDQIQHSTPHSPMMQIQTLFFKWRQQNGRQATVEAFVKLLHDAQVPVLDFLDNIDQSVTPDPFSLNISLSEHWV